MQRQSAQKHTANNPKKRKRTQGESLIENVSAVATNQDEPKRQQRLLECQGTGEVEEVEAEPVGISVALENLGPTDRMNILDTMIDRVMGKYEYRYGEFLKSDSGRKLKGILEGNLNPKVKSICARSCH